MLPEPNNFFGLRRNSWRQAVVRHLQLCQDHRDIVNKSSPINSTHYVMLYPQNGDSFVTIDSLTSLHPMYISNDGLVAKRNYYNSI